MELIVVKILCTCAILAIVGTIISLLTLDVVNPITEFLQKVIPYIVSVLALINALALVVAALIKIWS